MNDADPSFFPSPDGQPPPDEPTQRPRFARGRWLANAGYAALLVVMAVLPSTSIDVGASVPDWAAHAVAYGVQAALITWASRPSLGRFRALAAGVVGASGFGAVTELLQLLQPQRSVELADLVANTVGALVACAVIGALGRSAPRVEG